MCVLALNPDSLEEQWVVLAAVSPNLVHIHSFTFLPPWVHSWVCVHVRGCLRTAVEVWGQLSSHPYLPWGLPPSQCFHTHSHLTWPHVNDILRGINVRLFVTVWPRILTLRFSARKEEKAFLKSVNTEQLLLPWELTPGFACFQITGFSFTVRLCGVDWLCFMLGPPVPMFEFLQRPPYNFKRCERVVYLWRGHGIQAHMGSFIFWATRDQSGLAWSFDV